MEDSLKKEGEESPRMIGKKRGIMYAVAARTTFPIQHCTLISKTSIMAKHLKVLHSKLKIKLKRPKRV